MSFSSRTPEKIMTIEELLRWMALWRMQEKKVVFTNGCFDIVHRGHVEYLMAAADLGDKLIIGLNSDASVKTLNKGDSRPLQDEKSRALVLASMSFVTAVILFDENTPENLITKLSPNILAKGGDYTVDQIAGAQHVLSKGGKVEIIPLVDGYSTSGIEKKIRQS